MIRFFTEDTTYTLPQKIAVRQWLTSQAKLEKVTVQELNYIFCSDEYLLQVNREHLNHDYYTDIITFDTSDEADVIEGDIFVSIDRVDDNRQTQHTSFIDELHRVLAHGLLHLCGYGDKSDEEVIRMRQKEDEWLLARAF